MPIYEFYCSHCNTIFNFFSKTINTRKTPSCPKCDAPKLSRQMSAFAVTGRASENEDTDDLPFDESQMTQAMHMLAGEADRLDDDNPKQAADLMRKLSHMTGMQLGAGMEEALARMESGEDPEQIEADMGDILESEDPFTIGTKRSAARSRPAPMRDDTLYDL